MAFWNKKTDNDEPKLGSNIAAFDKSKLDKVKKESEPKKKEGRLPLMAGITKLAWAMFSFTGWFFLWSFICLVCLPYSITQLVILLGIGSASPAADLAFVLGPPALLTTAMWIYVFYVSCKRWCLFIKRKLYKDVAKNA